MLTKPLQGDERRKRVNKNDSASYKMNGMDFWTMLYIGSEVS